MIVRTTESTSNYRHLEKMSSFSILNHINNEDKKVALAVEKVIPVLVNVVDLIYHKMINGGRLFYIGAGTSGRLGIVDASECPPTFGVPHDMVIGIIAGGDSAIRKAVEFAEDDAEQAIRDLEAYKIDCQDVVIGIAASGSTPYVIGGINACRNRNILTVGVCCNVNSALETAAEHAIVCEVGPEFVTGSTRMKAGTAQKLILNMISTSVMIKLGRVVDNKMVDMQLSNNKLVDRGSKMIMASSELDYESAKKLLLKSGSVRVALDLVKRKE